MRIALLSDLHANLPFAEAALRRARRAACDVVVHLGDAIDLGPWPSETLDFLESERVIMIRGNHDEYPLLGLTAAIRARLRPEVIVHMDWTASQLRPDQLDLIGDMPTRLMIMADDWTVRLQHFLLDGDRVSEEYLGDSIPNALSRFSVEEGQIVCFGHTHNRFWYFSGDRGLLNPGATGFHVGDTAWFAVLVTQDVGAWVEWHAVDCPRANVVAELERRRVPAWQDSVNYMFESAAV